MAAVINTNIASLNTQRNLNTSQSALNTSIQRLSSGLRINSAKDDAAGLAISERMNAQVRGLNVAARNANDGVSLAQTAEGALGKVGDMLQRMRELAVQSANATNSTDDRTALDAEVTQLKEEIQRVADTTKFNGTKLLDGSFTAQDFQVGANAGETITLASIADADLDALGELTTSVTYTAATPALGLTSNTLATSITINGAVVAIGADATNASAADAYADFATEIADLKANGTAAEKAALDGVTINATTGVISLSSTSQQNLAITAPSANVSNAAAMTATHTVTETATTETGIANLTVGTPEDAAWALDAIDSALNAVNSARGTLGAVQSRFESAVSNIQIQSENLSAAKSRIVDADFAAETAALTRGQILQQAGTAMLAQANQLPNNVLSLLR